MDVQALIGWNVSRLRKLKELSQEKLAQNVEVVGQPYISNLEAGEHNPSALVLFLIAKALDVPISELFSEVNAPADIVNGPVIIRSPRAGKRNL